MSAAHEGQNHNSAHTANGTPEPHLPHGSIWPFVMAVAISLVGLAVIFVDFGALMAGGAGFVAFLAGNPLMVAGLVVLGIALAGWINEDVKWWKTNTGTGPGMAKAGTLLFISSEIFIFGALFATYFTFQSQAHAWPDMTTKHVHPHLPVLKTLIFSLFLFASSATIHKAEGHLKRGEHSQFRMWWLITIVLGAIFLLGQVLEYLTLVEEGLGLRQGSQFMVAFFMITGTHGLHVFGGMMFLMIVYIRAMKGQFDAERHAAPQTASMYWHFVDLVWVIVFTVLYIVPWSQGKF